MAEGKYGTNPLKDVKAFVSALRARRTTLLLTYAFMFGFVACIVFLAFNPTATSSPWITRIFSSPNPDASYKSQFNSLLSRFFPYTPRPSSPLPFSSDGIPAPNQTLRGQDSVISTGSQTHLKPDAAANRTQGKPENESSKGAVARNQTQMKPDSSSSKQVLTRNQTQLKPVSPSSKENPFRNHTLLKPDASSPKEIAAALNQTQSTPDSSKEILARNQTQQKPESSGSNKSPSELATSLKKRNGTAASAPAPTAKVEASAKQGSRNVGASAAKGRGWKELVDGLKHCDIFDGRWVKDDSYPLYPAGSCPLIDESFNCILNGRPDRSYQKLRWKPNDCEIPR